MKQKNNKPGNVKKLALKGMESAARKMSGIDVDSKSIWDWPPTCAAFFHQPKRPAKK